MSFQISTELAEQIMQALDNGQTSCPDEQDRAECREAYDALSAVIAERTEGEA